MPNDIVKEIHVSIKNNNDIKLRTPLSKENPCTIILSKDLFVRLPTNTHTSFTYKETESEERGHLLFSESAI